jgi:hypothetical protein
MDLKRRAEVAAFLSNDIAVDCLKFLLSRYSDMTIMYAAVALRQNPNHLPPKRNRRKPRLPSNVVSFEDYLDRVGQ